LWVGNLLALDTSDTETSPLAFYAYIWTPFGIFSVFSALILVSFFVYALLVSDPFQHRATGALVEGIWILVIVGLNLALYVREDSLQSAELLDRAVGLIEKLKDAGMNMIQVSEGCWLSLKFDPNLTVSAFQEVRIPSAWSVSVARVVRDGVVRTFPFNLLVDGDIIELAYGDRAPCRARYVFCSPRLPTDKTEYVLEKSQLFTPSLFGIPPAKGLDRELSLNNGRFQFVLTETPLSHCLRDSFDSSRPLSLIANQLGVVWRIWRYRIIWIVAALALLANVLRFAIPYSVGKVPGSQWFEMILVMSDYVLLPMLMLPVPALLLGFRAYGNAQVLTLFHQLQATKQDYEDEEDVDEFDAAPPPTMDIDLDWRE